MLIDFIKKYKYQTLKLKKEIELNQQIDILIQSLTSEEKFLSLDISLLMAFLKENKYLKYPLEKVETTFIYIQRNHSFLDANCQGFIQDIIVYLNSFKKDIIKINEYNHLFTRLDKLLENIENNQFIDDIDLIIRILKELDVNKEEVFSCMQEINNHNNSIFTELSLKNKTIPQVQEKKDDINILKLLQEYGYKNDLTPFEKKLLQTISSETLEEKLKYFKEKREFSFLKDREYQRLLMTLLALSPIENIEKIRQLSDEYILDIKNILPTSYLNIGFELNQELVSFLSVEDEYYEKLAGSYEYFLDNIEMLLKLGYDVSLTFLDNPMFFISPNDLMWYNLQVFHSYEIPLNNTSRSLITALETFQLVDHLDGFIEAGLYEYVKENNSKLFMNDPAFFHRIYYAKENKLPYKRRFLLKEITDANGYDINAENYLEVVKTYTSPVFDTPFYLNLLNHEKIEVDSKILSNRLISILEENYLLDKNVYFIAGRHISRQKVLRLYQTVLESSDNSVNYFEGILFAIFEGLLVDKDKFDEIVLEVMNLFLINGLIYSSSVMEICNNLEVDWNKLFSYQEGEVIK